jgi:hypothetical protein
MPISGRDKSTSTTILLLLISLILVLNTVPPVDGLSTLSAHFDKLKDEHGSVQCRHERHEINHFVSWFRLVSNTYSNNARDGSCGVQEQESHFSSPFHW